MRKKESKQDQILKIVKKQGIIRPKDALKKGIAAQYLYRMQEKGLLDRPGRGIYVLPGADFEGQESLVQACKRISQGVVCLLSALSFHELTTQSPSEIWIAIPNKARTPSVKDLPIRTVRFSKEALTAGIEKHKVNGTLLRVYSPGKTVADCFKYRNKIGLEVAIEALRECWRTKKCTADSLWRFAKICRVDSIMKPYMEMLS